MAAGHDRRIPASFATLLWPGAPLVLAQRLVVPPGRFDFPAGVSRLLVIVDGFGRRVDSDGETVGYLGAGAWLEVGETADEGFEAMVPMVLAELRLADGSGLSSDDDLASVIGYDAVGSERDLRARESAEIGIAFGRPVPFRIAVHMSAIEKRTRLGRSLSHLRSLIPTVQAFSAALQVVPETLTHGRAGWRVTLASLMFASGMDIRRESPRLDASVRDLAERHTKVPSVQPAISRAPGNRPPPFPWWPQSERHAAATFQRDAVGSSRIVAEPRLGR
jgi:hypothetical protein